MILSKRVVWLLLFALTVANVLFRYPLDVPHELGADTSFVHTLAASIMDKGHAAWILHVLSYFGLYALSYPSAMPFIFASGSLATSMPVEGVMLYFGWIASIVGGWGAFLAARAIRRDDVFALLVAGLFSLTPFYLKDTFWIGSSRGFVVALLPGFVLLLVRHLHRPSGRNIGIILLITSLLAAIHRMGFLTLFVLVAFLFAIPFHKLTQRLRFALIRYERPARHAFFLSSVGGFVLMFYIQFAYPGLAGADVVEQYGEGAFFEGESFSIILANMGISLAGKIGPLLPIAVVGLVVYTWRRPKEVTDRFVLTAFLVFLPMMSLRDYIAEFLFLFFILLLGVGLLWMMRLVPNRRRLVVLGVAGLLAMSVGTSWVMKDYWRVRYATDAPLSVDTYNTGVYLIYTTDGILIANEGLLGGHLAAVSGRPVLPSGGPSFHWTSPQQLMWGIVSSDEVAVHLMDLTAISFNTDEIYLPVGVRNTEIDWEQMLFYTDPGLADSNLRIYGVHFVVVDKRMPFSFESYGFVRPSRLLVFANQDSYKVYDSSRHAIWLVR